MKIKKKNRIDEEEKSIHVEDIRIDKVVEVIRYAEENIDQEKNISFYVKEI